MDFISQLIQKFKILRFMKQINHLDKKRSIILITTIGLTLLYYFMALYYVRVSPTRKNLVFFHWLFGSFLDSTWIDFWQYIFQFFLSFLLFFIVPIIIIKYYFKEDLKDYGIHWGKKKFNLIWTIIGVGISPLFLFISNDPALLNEYPLTRLVLNDIGLFIVFNLVYIFYYIGYEFIFRAYLQFGLKKENTKRTGIILILITSTIITTLFHIGKPLTELIAAAAVGPLFGYLTLRGKSFIWPVLIFHTLIGIFGNIATLIWI